MAPSPTDRARPRAPAPMVRNCLRDTMGLVLFPCASARTRASGPCRHALPELIQLEQPHPAARLGRRSRLGSVVTPGGQIEADVLEVGMGGDMLQGLEPILDEPDARAPALRLGVGADQRPQVVALVCARDRK